MRAEAANRAGEWARFLVGAVFLLSAALKALDLEAFAVLVSWYGIVREPAVVRWVAWGVVVVETALGAGLLIGRRDCRAFLVASAGTLAVFMALVAYGWAFRDLSECGCFGRYIRILPFWSLVKSGVLMALVVAAWRFGRERGRRRLGPSATLMRGYVGGILLLGGSIVLWAAWEAATAGGGVLGEHGAGESGARRLSDYSVRWQGSRLTLSEGEYLVAMLSDSCEECEKIVSTLNRYASNPSFPQVVGLVLGTEESLARFREQYQPAFATRILPPLEFFQFIGDAPPRFYLMRDGRVLAKWDGGVPPEAQVWEVLMASRGKRFSEQPSAGNVGPKCISQGRLCERRSMGRNTVQTALVATYSPLLGIWFHILPPPDCLSRPAMPSLRRQRPGRGGIAV